MDISGGIQASLSGRYALAHHIDRLADDHARARRLADALAPFGVVDPASVQTNIVLLDLSKSTVDAHTVAARARERDVLVSVLAPDLGRLITHLDIDDTALDQAIDFLRDELKDGPKPVAQIETKAQAQGIAARTIDRARKEIGVLARKVKASWMLSLPHDQ